MKKSKFIIAGVWVALISLMWSCEQDGSEPDLQDESFFINNILMGSNSVLDHARSQGFGGPMGALYAGFVSSGNGRSAVSPSQLFRNMGQGRVADFGDSTDIELPECLIEIWEDDGNGNYTFSMDFGDGCYYYGYYMFGKMVETGSYSENGFSSTTTYTHFGGSADEGGEDWSMDGTQSYSGTWEELENDDPNNDTTWMYNATYEFSADLVQRYIEYGYPEDSNEVSTGEQIITMDYEAEGSEEMDHLGYTVKSRTMSIEMDTGDSFHSQINVPLYYDYSCESTWVAVSGNESGDYTYGEISGTYSVDYGDGTCDNIITVTENGVTEDVDLGDIWVGWCGTE